MVNDSPEQMEPLLTEMTGRGLTVMLELEVAVFCEGHPAELVPVTVKDVLELGETTLVPPWKAYRLAPVALMVNELPEQMVPLLTEIVGVLYTVTMDVTVFDTHPAVLVPVTENACVLEGLTSALPPW
jgi:hypothetical protein